MQVQHDKNQVETNFTPATCTTGIDGKVYKRPDTSRDAVEARVEKMREMADAGASKQSQ